jgi:pyridoxal biosynthesis lyase PdxS
VGLFGLGMDFGRLKDGVGVIRIKGDKGEESLFTVFNHSQLIGTQIKLNKNMQKK